MFMALSIVDLSVFARRSKAPPELVARVRPARIAAKAGVAN
jgi:hypothetical protein